MSQVKLFCLLIIFPLGLFCAKASKNECSVRTPVEQCQCSWEEQCVIVFARIYNLPAENPRQLNELYQFIGGSLPKKYPNSKGFELNLAAQAGNVSEINKLLQKQPVLDSSIVYQAMFFAMEQYNYRFADSFIPVGSREEVVIEMKKHLRNIQKKPLAL